MSLSLLCTQSHPLCPLLVKNYWRVQRHRFHGRWQYLFIESIITDPLVLEQNYKYKMMYSPDYRRQNPDKVRRAFWRHLGHEVRPAVAACRPWTTSGSASGSMSRCTRPLPTAVCTTLS